VNQTLIYTIKVLLRICMDLFIYIRGGLTMKKIVVSSIKIKNTGLVFTVVNRFYVPQRLALSNLY